MLNPLEDIELHRVRCRREGYIVGCSFALAVTLISLAIALLANVRPLWPVALAEAVIAAIFFLLERRSVRRLRALEAMDV